jgi:hypothetical protein
MRNTINLSDAKQESENFIQQGATIEQSINFISEVKAGMNDIFTQYFTDGVKSTTAYYQKNILARCKYNENGMRSLVVSTEKPVSKFTIEKCNKARIKLRLSRVVGVWRHDLTLVKNIASKAELLKNISTFKAKMLFKIDMSKFAVQFPWDFIDAAEYEIEHLPGKSKSLKVSDLQQDASDLSEYLHIIGNALGKQGILRNMWNSVFEMNKADFYKNVASNMQDFYISNKADGVRTILIISNGSIIAVNNTIEKHEGNGDAILDAEYVDGKYYVFDAIAHGDSVIDLPTHKRLEIAEKVVKTAMCDLLVMKKFVLLTENFGSEIRDMYAYMKELPYENDGIIFTPKNGKYFSPIWKYKHVKTIDLLVKQSPFSDELWLFCGINRKTFTSLNMILINGYEKIFPMRGLPYFPIQFSPSCAEFAYIWKYPDDCKEEKADIVNNVCEFTWIDNKFVFAKIRTDKADDVKANKNFGNAFYTAEYTLGAMIDPLSIEELCNPKKDGAGYFAADTPEMYRTVINYNSRVKNALISRYKNLDFVIDLAGGRGADMFRMNDIGIKHGLFVDIDGNALSELITRKHNIKKGSISMKVSTHMVDLSLPYKKVLDGIFAHQKEKANASMMNFAIHYLCGSSETIANFAKIVSGLLLPGATFCFTSFDGGKIYDLLRKDGSWIVHAGASIKYGIKKLYKSQELEPFGQPIDVVLPFKQGEYTAEFLANFDAIIDVFAEHELKLVERASFADFANKEPFLSMFNKMDKDERLYMGLHGYCIFTLGQK